MNTLTPTDRPREKLERVGAAGLGDNELVALVLGLGGPSATALDLANRILAEVDGVVGLTRVSADRLRQVPGVGAAKASQVLAAVELGRRTLIAQADRRQRFASPREVASFLLPRYSARGVEQFGVVLLDARHRLIKATVLSVGTLDCSVVHPRDVFREAAIGGASTLVLFHNHPSGDPTPSHDDEILTRRFVAAGELMGVEVMDHLILADARYFSFREAGRLEAG
ncbi:MAG: repair protein RadC [Acidobacteria bacterium]|nr:repair protein RadC [Acidobacteriota bacterium]